MSKPRQPKLPGASTRAKRGVTERAAGTDLSIMRGANMLPAGTEALATSYRLLAREVDRAEDDEDGYRKINAVRELRNVRNALAGVDPNATPEELDDLLRGVSAALRDAARHGPPDARP